MSGTTLFVVDMQDGFYAYAECLKDVIREIRLAKRRNDPIVFVELDPKYNNKTRPELIKAAESGGYKKLAVTTKIGGDGSVKLVTAAKNAGFKYDHVRVCGVNRGACVSNTINGLLNMGGIKVEVGFAATAPGPKKFEDDATTYIHDDYKAMFERGLILKK